MEKLFSKLTDLLVICRRKMLNHRASYSNSYDLDIELQSLFKDTREFFSSILDGADDTLSKELERLENLHEGLIHVERTDGLARQSCYLKSQWGTPSWRVKRDASFITNPKMQALLCSAFIGPAAWLCGAEDGKSLTCSRNSGFHAFSLVLHSIILPHPKQVPYSFGAKQKL